ncbi:MAG: ParB/RepB/Spo0J family partition protein [Nitrososphaerota archaeon]|jgi:ParB-like chromosome segregation protein Spo0J|nr:ParB/RepB/Spo0J family partition protein [Nitrososphaerota archaeon]
MSLRLNPLYEKMLPTMTQEEFEQLKESIRTEGQHYPIIVSDDLEVLDGHHRFRACMELDIEPDFEVKHFENKLLEKKFVIEANLHRRHLNNFQIVELAVPLLEIEKAIAKKQYMQNNQTSSDNSSNLSVTNDDDGDSFPEFKPTGKIVKSIAKKAGVSTQILERGKKILEKANEDDKQKLREGKTSINKVYREITPQKILSKTELNPQNLQNSATLKQNKKVLAQILKIILDQNLFCPECGNKLFQCSKCHKQLNELVKDTTQPTHHLQQQQQPKTQIDQQTNENEPFKDDEIFKDEFF